MGPPKAGLRGRVTGRVADAHVGVGYDLRRAQNSPGVVPGEISAFAFRARGDCREYRVKLERDTAAGDDIYVADFTPLKGWSTFVIPVSEFRNVRWPRRTWTPRTIDAITFETVGGPRQSAWLEVEKITLCETASQEKAAARGRPLFSWWCQ